MSVLVAAPILLSLTLLLSGISKLGGRQATEDAMTSLRLPLAPVHGIVAAILPVAEIVLALALWVPVISLQVAAAALVALLMLSYLVIIGRALSWDEIVECSCFGTLASPTISRATLARNVVLTILGVLGLLGAGSGATADAVTQSPLVLLGWTSALAAAVVLALGGIHRSPGTEPVSPDRDGHRAAEDVHQFVAEDPGSAETDPLDYERSAIPAAVLQRPGGELVTLRSLSAQQAALLVFVSEGCGPCERVLDEVPGWLEDLSPVLQIKLVFSRPLEQLGERTAQRIGEHGLYDLQFSAREVLGAAGTPSAVLLGADGLLAGGPVRGGTSVLEFVGEIQEQLQLARQQGELPAAEK